MVQEKPSTRLWLIVLMLPALLAGCARATTPAAPPPEPTSAPERYVDAAGGFSLALPAGWTAATRPHASLGTEVRLLSAADATPGGTFYYAARAELDRETALARLCSACASQPEVTATTVQGQPAWRAVLADRNGGVEWTLVENGDVLVLFTLAGAEDDPDRAALLASLRFAPVVDAERRAVEMAEAMRQTLAGPAGDDDAVTVEAVDAITWADACLGVPLAGEACAETATAGYRIALAGPAGEYIFHFEPITMQIRVAAAPPVETGPRLLEWRSPTLPCESVNVGRDGLSFGACGSTILLPGQPPDAARGELLQALRAELAPFEAETPAGYVRFAGRGSRAATPAEQRQLAEVARLVHAEASGADPAGGVVLTWARDGGLAGFCDSLTVLITGEMRAQSCRTPEALAAGVLDLEDLVQLYTWHDLWSPGDGVLEDDATADNLQVTVHFHGGGSQSPTDADLAALAGFAAHLFAKQTIVDGALDGTPAGDSQ